MVSTSWNERVQVTFLPNSTHYELDRGCACVRVCVCVTDWGKITETEQEIGIQPTPSAVGEHLSSAVGSEMLSESRVTLTATQCRQKSHQCNATFSSPLPRLMLNILHIHARITCHHSTNLLSPPTLVTHSPLCFNTIFVAWNLVNLKISWTDPQNDMTTYSCIYSATRHYFINEWSFHLLGKYSGQCELSPGRSKTLTHLILGT